MAKRVSEYRERIAIEHQPTTTTDTYGQEIGDWETFRQCWAKWTPAKSQENNVNNQMVAAGSGTFECQFFTGLSEEMRIIWRGKTLNISGFSEDRLTELVLIEVAEKK